jgi:glycosyltransferase involved in cell wall biosynthesis
LFHQENAGVGAARQKGISEARGVYSLHVDSDDMIDAVLLERLQLQINKTNCDLLFMNYYEITPKGRELYRRLDFPAESARGNSNAVLSAILRGGGVPGYIWFVVVKHNLYKKYSIVFPRDIVYGEDTLVLIELLLHNPRTAFLDEGYYRYSFNPVSITHTSSREKHYIRLNFLEKLNALLIRYGRNDFLTDEYDYFKIDAKYEMLSDGLFSKNEYRSLLKINAGKSRLSRYGLKKSVLLKMAENGPYFLARFIAVVIRRLRNILK